MAKVHGEGEWLQGIALLWKEVKGGAIFLQLQPLASMPPWTGNFSSEGYGILVPVIYAHVSLSLCTHTHTIHTHTIYIYIYKIYI